MANDRNGAGYGSSTKEEHRRSGYILPDSHYEPAERDDLDTSTTKPDGVHTAEGAPPRTRSKPAPAENKVRTPVAETKAPARKAASKTARKRK